MPEPKPDCLLRDLPAFGGVGFVAVALGGSGSPVNAVAASSYGIVVALAFVCRARRALEYILRGAFFRKVLSFVISLGARVNFRRRCSPPGPEPSPPVRRLGCGHPSWT